MTSMTMAKVVRKDSGKYEVAIENELGKSELIVNVIVLGEIRDVVCIYYEIQDVVYIL